MDTILHGLNEQQKCAVTSPAPVLQVLAPPGSGKTKTLTTRVAYLIAHRGMKPWNMIVCTFTIKAAKEMKERIRKFIGDEFEAKLVLGTFHSIARRYLARYGHYIGIPKSFGIADTSDSLAIIKRIVKRNDFNMEPSKARSRISKRKSEAATGDPKTRPKQDTEQQEFEIIFEQYEESLKTSSLLDYDDLLLRCVELLKRCPECVSNIEAVLIDEFQDTNHVQYELMSLFAQHRKPNTNGRVPSITIVGDPDQSIYSFRSAEIKNLKKMARQYADTQIVLLEENYRSSASILLSAVEVIEQDETRPQKKLLATHNFGERPVLRTLPSAAAEAAWIVAEINRSKALTGELFNNADFAILLRSASLSRHIESALGRAGIPYRMVGGSKFFDRIEVKLLLDYLRVISQPDHNDAMARIINVPSRKIGDPTIKALLEEAETKQQNLWNLVLDIAQGKRRANTKISTQCQKGLETFTNVILTSQKRLRELEDSASIVGLLHHLIKKLSLESYLRTKHPEDFDGRWANIEELISLATDGSTLQDGSELSDVSFSIEGVEERIASSAEECLTKFLANVALVTAVDRATEDENAPKQVTISTIHAAKGLEWPVVFIPAAYQGSIPHSRAEDNDEERRLLYVGMTRAKALLYLSWPKKSSASEATSLSPFLSGTKIAPRFTTIGPGFGFETAKNLARILGRDCPSEESIIDALVGVERVADDFWPENGEDGQLENTYLSGQYFVSDRGSNYSSRSLTIETSVKRQKTGQTSFAPVSVMGVGMPTSGPYSINNTTISSGFRSAGIVRKEIEERSANEVTRRNVPNKEEQRMEKTLKPGRKKHISGQGNLLSFFGKLSAQGPLPPIEPDVLPVPAMTQERRFPPKTQDFLRDFSNEMSPASKSRVPKMPSSLTNHKPRMLPSSGRPPKTIHDGEHYSGKHMLLSSSPMKPDEMTLAKSVDESPTKENNPKNIEQMSEGVFVQASTMHTTTMTRLSQNGQQQRKTLGVRRSMQGWSTRVHQPFSAPGKPRGGK